MVKFLGYAKLSGVCLRYYVCGNNRDGYCIRIVEKNGDSQEQVEQYVSQKLPETVYLAYKLRRCSVFPENLPEILEDMRFDQSGHPSPLSASFPHESSGVLA